MKIQAIAIDPGNGSVTAVTLHSSCFKELLFSHFLEQAFEK